MLERWVVFFGGFRDFLCVTQFVGVGKIATSRLRLVPSPSGNLRCPNYLSRLNDRISKAEEAESSNSNRPTKRAPLGPVSSSSSAASPVIRRLASYYSAHWPMMPQILNRRLVRRAGNARHRRMQNQERHPNRRRKKRNDARRLTPQPRERVYNK